MSLGRARRAYSSGSARPPSYRSPTTGGVAQRQTVLSDPSNTYALSFLKTRPARLTCAFHNCPDYLLRSLASSTRETSWPVAVGASA